MSNSNSGHQRTSGPLASLSRLEQKDLANPAASIAGQRSSRDNQVLERPLAGHPGQLAFITVHALGLDRPHVRCGSFIAVPKHLACVVSLSCRSAIILLCAVITRLACEAGLARPDRGLSSQAQRKGKSFPPAVCLCPVPRGLLRNCSAGKRPWQHFSRRRETLQKPFIKEPSGQRAPDGWQELGFYSSGRKRFFNAGGGF